jgi:hypothetical protein
MPWAKLELLMLQRLDLLEKRMMHCTYKLGQLIQSISVR